MSEKITAITLKKGITRVNCFLIKTDNGFILIDTGLAQCRTFLLAKLKSAGCEPGNLKLIILTHGDFDHIGNCQYLRTKFNTKIAMHSADTGMAEKGDMFWNRNTPNFLMKSLAKLLFKLNLSDRFTPDICLNDEDDLEKHGLKAKVLSIPGHSAGSIGILTANGNLFCGDLFENINKPKLSSIMDNLKVAKLSAQKLANLKISTVYPGHGNPFKMEDFKGK